MQQAVPELYTPEAPWKYTVPPPEMVQSIGTSAVRELVPYAEQTMSVLEAPSAAPPEDTPAISAPAEHEVAHPTASSALRVVERASHMGILTPEIGLGACVLRWIGERRNARKAA